MVNERAVRSVFEGAMKLKPHESCLIVTDTIKEPIGRAFYNYALTITSNSRMVVIEPSKEHASEPSDEVAGLMLEYDVQLLITDKSLTHTSARREASKKGARIATMPMITEDIANRCLEIDYEDLRKKSQWLYNILKDAKEVRVTTAKGTDITFTIGRSLFFGENGGSFDYPGAYGNLPEGEVSFGPEDCHGQYVVDASFPGMGLLESPLKFKVKDCMVYEIEGQRSEEVISRLNKAGKPAFKVAELGIGLNPKANIIGTILEDEKVIGTVHIAVGNNLSYGGDNDVPLHLDGVIRNPDIFVDNILIMEEGRFK